MKVFHRDILILIIIINTFLNLLTIIIKNKHLNLNLADGI